MYTQQENTLIWNKILSFAKLEARQEGQGIHTTCQNLGHHFNPRATGRQTAVRMHGRHRLSIAPCQISSTNQG